MYPKNINGKNDKKLSLQRVRFWIVLFDRFLGRFWSFLVVFGIHLLPGSGITFIIKDLLVAIKRNISQPSNDVFKFKLQSYPQRKIQGVPGNMTVGEYRVSQETWQLVNSFKCLLPWFVKFFYTKENKKNIAWQYYYNKVDFKAKYNWVKDYLAK